jgi:hypothetical protein
MKKYIRAMLDDLQQKKSERDFIPPVPAAPTDGKTVYLGTPPQPPVAEDLDNQELSCDPEERVEQLDYQAQQDEERETLE